MTRHATRWSMSPPRSSWLRALLRSARLCASGRMRRSRIAVPLSTGVWSADGELLRVTRAADDQYRLWVPLSADIAAARRGVSAERRSLVLLARRRQSDRARARRLPHL